MTTSAIKTRIDYIDLLKGFAIIWIVWFHTKNHPIIIDLFYHVPIFFFLSGVFYKQRLWPDFIKTITKSLLVPFIFFYILSYPLCIGLFVWQHGNIQGFNWLSILDIFHIASDDRNYLSINVALWFLICLFFVELYYFFIRKLQTTYVWIIIALLLCCSSLILKIPSPFMMNKALCWIVFYAVGDLYGKKIITIIKQTNRRRRLFFIGVYVYIIAMILRHLIGVKFINDILWSLKAFSFIFICLSLFYLLDEKKLRILRFFGKNSLIVLGTHIPILYIVEYGISFFWGLSNDWTELLCVIITLIIIVPIILIINRYFPGIVGKDKNRYSKKIEV